MARITVEDCLANVDNRFELVLLSSKRARQLANGQESKLDWDNDKCTVVALREIAQGLITNDNVEAQVAQPEEIETETAVEGPDASAKTE